MIRAVSFDIDDTLYDFMTPSSRALEFVAARIRQELGAPAAEVNFDLLIDGLMTVGHQMKNPCVIRSSKPPRRI